jgi:hypothetical protein
MENGLYKITDTIQPVLLLVAHCPASSQVIPPDPKALPGDFQGMRRKMQTLLNGCRNSKHGATSIISLSRKTIIDNCIQFLQLLCKLVGVRNFSSPEPPFV